jgi:septum site-determining protein MinC
MKRRRQVVIKGGSLPVLRIVVRDGEVDSLRTEVAETVENARPMLAEAIAVLDLREREAGETGAASIVEVLRDSGVRLAAVLVGERTERASLAALGVPVMEVPLPARDRPGHGGAGAQHAADAPQPASAGRAPGESGELEQPTAQSPGTEASVEQVTGPVSEAAATAAGSLTPADTAARADIGPAYLTRPLRSGQRFYAQGRDVVVAAPTSRGSELIADGSVYSFGPLRGRVLAGASGNTGACIVASQLDAELVAVAGVYRIFEADDLKALGSGPVSVTLSVDADGSERLTLAPVAASSQLQRK